MLISLIKIYTILIGIKENSFKDSKQKLEFFASFRPELLKIITLENYEKNRREINALIRNLFTFYAANEEYNIEGFKFFSLFPEITKQDKFNSFKAFLFYFAYITKTYNTKEVKEILEQSLINATIVDNKTYLDFCMYCYYRGLYYLEKMDFYMATYYYCVAIQGGIKSKLNSAKYFNNFNTQMIRSLCFLRYLTNFNIKEIMNKESRIQQFDESSAIDHQDVACCLSFINKEKDDLKVFKEFCRENDENIKKCHLLGLKKAAEEEIIFRIIKDVLKIYKKIKMTKIASLKQLEVSDIMRVLKKKVMEGELNIKYDESEDIIEVYDLDPGLKEKVKKTTDLYEKIIEGHKNMFTTLKVKKMDQLSGKTKDMTENDIILNMGATDIRIPGMDEMNDYDEHMDEDD